MRGDRRPPLPGPLGAARGQEVPQEMHTNCRKHKLEFQNQFTLLCPLRCLLRYLSILQLPILCTYCQACTCPMPSTLLPCFPREAPTACPQRYPLVCLGRCPTWARLCPQRQAHESSRCTHGCCPDTAGSSLIGSQVRHLVSEFTFPPLCKSR